MQLPPLNALRAFEAVARLGSFQAAGAALFVTQSAISHQIRNFEDWLGAPLFERVGNKTKLLPHAEDLARALSQSLGDITVACQRARAGAERPALVIAAIPSVAMCWLIPRLSQFRAGHPEVEIRIIYAMHGRDIDFHNTHVAFVFAAQPPDTPGLHSQFFLPGAVVPVCSPALLNQLGRKPRNASDYQKLGLLHDGGSSGWRQWLKLDDKPISGARFEDFNLLRAAALSGQGVALCPAAMVQPDIDAGSLVQLSDDRAAGMGEYYLVTRAAASHSLAKQVEIFSDWAMAAR